MFVPTPPNIPKMQLILFVPTPPNIPNMQLISRAIVC